MHSIDIWVLGWLEFLSWLNYSLKRYVLRRSSFYQNNATQKSGMSSTTGTQDRLPLNLFPPRRTSSLANPPREEPPTCHRQNARKSREAVNLVIMIPIPMERLARRRPHQRVSLETKRSCTLTLPRQLHASLSLCGWYKKYHSMSILQDSEHRPLDKVRICALNRSCIASSLVGYLVHEGDRDAIVVDWDVFLLAPVIVVDY